MIVNKRLFEVRRHLGLTQQQIADILGVGQNTYSMIENGRLQLTERNRSILAERLYINPKYLSEGVGDMIMPLPVAGTIKRTNQGEWIVNRAGVKTSQNVGVPFYAKPVTGSMVISYDDLQNEPPEYFVDIAPLNDCSFYRPVFGESMSPRYNPGDIVACKKVNNKNVILYGESYLCMIALDGDFYETIKVLRRNSEVGMITLKPYNDSFDETTVPIDAIKDLYLIKGKIERNI